MKTEKKVIEKIKFGEEKTGTGKNNKPYSAIDLGLQIDGKWYNGRVFDVEYARSLQSNQEVEVELFEEEYKGKMYPKFKMKTPFKTKNEQLDRIENNIEKMFDVLRIVEKAVSGSYKEDTPF